MYDNFKIKPNSIQQQPRLNPIQNRIPTSNGFDQVLQQQLYQNKEIKFSKHAMERLEKRNIQLTPQDISRINQAFNIAQGKGIKETLILMDDRVFVASVSNKTVITAAVEDQLKENAFSNIDGAVII